MRKIIAIILVGFIAFISSDVFVRGQECKCKKSKSTETTRFGGNETIVLKEERSRKLLRGIVSSPSDGTEILIEVFDNSDYLLQAYPENITQKKDQRRVAACKIKAGDRFCFKKVPPGKYELRFSIAPHWNVTHIYVVLNPASKDSVDEDIQAYLWLGT